jgi:hypothetical protein
MRLSAAIWLAPLSFLLSLLLPFMAFENWGVDVFFLSQSGHLRDAMREGKSDAEITALESLQHGD